MTDESLSSRAFFQELQQAYDKVLRSAPAAGSLSWPLMMLARDSFDGNVRIQRQGEPPVACHRGCATCCSLQVGATAPEILAIARFLHALVPRLAEHGIDLVGAIRGADRVTHGISEEQRLELRQPCPFVARGVCVIYDVRPLACRGLASHDARACVDAASGRGAQVPYSPSMNWVRSIVQNALQSSLRQAGLPWGMYELNHAVLLAIDHPRPEHAWCSGENLFAAAELHSVPVDEMASVFDQLRRQNSAAARSTHH